ncbi:LiaI-LiaF-like domain-containing protein [Clostridium psychrophilum]|uniref:LiaI-LiaF-like domain-containing protein n=1 Tax=Clostridium psychrophilum TaxID=132926 RepID=UPI001C0AA2D3|nr:DUF5668 domain-containing protein [Clostridium psychrophilum]MBU3182105.1 hypothetical protein [Clostridium psychrophilum]
MIKGRRVGTITSGIILVIVGTVFLLRLVYPNIKYSVVASMWPIVLILLGIEIIVAYVINKEEVMKYDFGAIFILIMLSAFAMSMGCMEYVISHIEQFKSVF